MSRVYLITAASGIGAETAKLIAHGRDGDSVSIFLAALELSSCEKLASELSALGAFVSYRAGDLTDPTFAPRLIECCVSEFGRIDALFNVAGTSGRRYGDGPIHLCTEEGWSRTLETNLTTQYRMCREAVRVMLQQPCASDGQQGAILNMSSVLGFRPEREHFDTIAYAASKGAIIAMSRAMAISLAKSRIRVNAVAPGLTETAMSAHVSSDPQMEEFLRERQPLLQSMIPAKDVAETCKFLLTETSHAITGQVFVVDAGWCLT
jgi:NAD(P)-dependent dehydrogenase (short-subunit alcohol dehydrogenase family)